MNELHKHLLDSAYSRHKFNALSRVKLGIKYSPIIKKKEKKELFKLLKKKLKFDLEQAKEDAYFANRRANTIIDNFVKSNPSALDKINLMKATIKDCMPCNWKPRNVKELWSITKYCKLLELRSGFETDFKLEAQNRPAPTFESFLQRVPCLGLHCRARPSEITPPATPTSTPEPESPA